MFKDLSAEIGGDSLPYTEDRSLLLDNQTNHPPVAAGAIVHPVVCLSHLRWDFVYQRPQHLMSRFALKAPVLFFEEPIWGDFSEPHLVTGTRKQPGITVAQPHLPHGFPQQEINSTLAKMLEGQIVEMGLRDYTLWYYTPMAQEFSQGLKPARVVFDVMDELSAFKNAPPRLLELEQQLMETAEVVFTGGQSLFDAKKHRHDNIHPFPSSIEKEHFAQARHIAEDTADQAHIPHPRLGFYGVIDERFDIELLGQVAELRPDYHFVVLGPVVKIDPATLPQRENIHYLEGKTYNELPAFLAGWDAAMMPFALNESTRFISPTKTPEFLAGGKPVVSTPIRDVVSPYGNKHLVTIAHTAQEFAAGCDQALAQADDKIWLSQVDNFLAHISWDDTWKSMNAEINKLVNKQR